MLNFYTIFHLNLMYSSIEKAQRKKVIDKCYYPILRIAEEGFPLSIELTGLTLEIISREDPKWVDGLKNLIRSDKIELIGSGYSQIIGPLVPKDVNLKNQDIGLKVYEDILDVRPTIALINEMAYSKSMIDIYKESGYKAVIMEWNNPYRFNKHWKKEWLYYPQYAQGIRYKLPVIWVDSIAFQKFQRYAHGELSLREYIDYLYSHNRENNRFFSLYGNDAEIFNFRPGRYEAESDITHNEWNRIIKLLRILRRNDDFGFIFVAEALNHLEGNTLNLESPEQPIPVKKQEKYNINRWALTGRDDLKINTELAMILDHIRENDPTDDDWKKVLYFASSDFRTHITEKRWNEFIRDLRSFLVEHKIKRVPLKSTSKNTTFNLKYNRFYLTIESEGLEMIFSKVKGLTAKSIRFKNKDTMPLIGTLPHGYYDDISLGADFFSFHSVVERPGEHKYTNLSEVDYSVEQLEDRVILETYHEDRIAKFYRKYILLHDEIVILIKIEFPERSLSTIHPLNITFIPTSFDKDSLFFATHNGGSDLEVFYLKDKEVNHSQSLSSLISAKNGLGATEGIVVIGDKEKSIVVKHNRTMSALIPSIVFSPIDDTFFLRLQYSAQEIDDTFLPNDRPQAIECQFIIH